MPPVLAPIAAGIASAAGAVVSFTAGAFSAIGGAVFGAAGFTAGNFIGAALGKALLIGGISRAANAVFGGGRSATGAAINTPGTEIRMTNTPAAPRRVIYGETRVGGQIVYAEETGADNEYLHLVLVLAGHECAAISSVYFNDTELTLLSTGNDANGIARLTTSTAPYSLLVRIKKHLGASTQVADADLVSDSNSHWTSTHRLRGVCYLVVRLKWDTDAYPAGLPNISAVVQGRKVYDPRESSHDSADPSTWAYADNVALCAADYLHDSTFGLGVPWSAIDEDALIAAANVCDEDVTLAAGGTVDRYRANGVFTVDTAPESTLNHLADAMAGWIVWTAGQWTISAGTYTAPTITLDESHLVGPMSVQTKASRRDNANGVRGVFSSEDHDYQPTSFPAVTREISYTFTADAGTDELTVSAGHDLIDGYVGQVSSSGTLPTGLSASTDYYIVNADQDNDTFQLATSVSGSPIDITGAGSGTHTFAFDPYYSEDLRERNWRDLTLPFTRDGATAQRVARIHLERIRQPLRVDCLANLHALPLRPGDTVALSKTTLGWTAKAFRVENWRLAIDPQAGLAIALSLRETGSAIYDWTAADDEGTVDPIPNTTLPDPWSVTAPANLTLASGTSHLVNKGDGTIISRIRATWDESDEQNVLSGGAVEVQYKLNADSDWIPLPTFDGVSTVAYVSDVEDGEDYDVRVRFINTPGRRSSWTTVTSHTVVGKTASPSDVTGLSGGVAAGGGFVEIGWTEISDLDLAYYKVWYTTSGSLPLPSTPSGSPAYTVRGNYIYDSVSVGSSGFYRVWVKAVDTSGNESSNYADTGSQSY